MEAFAKFSLGSIGLSGWAGELLRRYANGLLGNLEEVWDDVGADNGWLGGDGDDWERGPYYVDGLVPTAFLLNDGKLMKKAENWINHCLVSQTQNGNFGPERNPDWWPRMVMLKAITQWADGKGEEETILRVRTFIDRYLVYFIKNIESHPFEMWAYVRGNELATSVIWMHQNTKNDKYLEILKKVLESSMDWKSFFASMPYTLTAEHYIPWKEFSEYLERFNASYGGDGYFHRRKDDPFFRTFHQTHGVNIAMGLKYIAYEYYLTHDKKLLSIMKKGCDELMRYHGQANGMFSCDEHLNGTKAIRGTELCSVVELMFSLEEIIRLTGDFSWADLLEKIAFNALPAAISEDGGRHQYNQQVNQVSATIDKRGWYNNLDDSNIFGLEPNFGCCTANMHQGLPKFISSSWLRKGNGYWCLSPIAGTFEDECIRIKVEGNYPFQDTVNIYVMAKDGKEHSINLHIPSWCDSWKASCGYIEKNGKVSYSKVFEDEVIKLSFKMMPEVHEADGGVYVMYGPIILSLPIEGEEKVVVDRGMFSDVEIWPKSEWRYSFELNGFVALVEGGGGNGGLMKKSDPYPLWMDTYLYKAEKWEMADSATFQVPTEIKNWKKTKVRLVPYGCTDLRITVFPKTGE